MDKTILITETVLLHSVFFFQFSVERALDEEIAERRAKRKKLQEEEEAKKKAEKEANEAAKAAATSTASSVPPLPAPLPQVRSQMFLFFCLWKNLALVNARNLSIICGSLYPIAFSPNSSFLVDQGRRAF